MDTVQFPKRAVDLLALIQKDGVIQRASELQEVYRLLAAHNAEPKGLTDEQIESLAHRQAHRYRHGPDSIEFIFNRECLLNFARALLAQGE